MAKENEAKKIKHTKSVLYGLYIVIALGVGLFIILLNIISRGGWFIFFSIILIVCLLFIICYIMVILFSLWLLKQPETVILSEKDAKERVKAKKSEEDGIHIHIGRPGK